MKKFFTIIAITLTFFCQDIDIKTVIIEQDSARKDVAIKGKEYFRFFSSRAELTTHYKDEHMILVYVDKRILFVSFILSGEIDVASYETNKLIVTKEELIENYEFFRKGIFQKLIKYQLKPYDEIEDFIWNDIKFFNAKWSLEKTFDSVKIKYLKEV